MIVQLCKKQMNLKGSVVLLSMLLRTPSPPETPPNIPNPCLPQKAKASTLVARKWQALVHATEPSRAVHQERYCSRLHSPKLPHPVNNEYLVAHHYYNVCLDCNNNLNKLGSWQKQMAWGYQTISYPETVLAVFRTHTVCRWEVRGRRGIIQYSLLRHPASVKYLYNYNIYGQKRKDSSPTGSIQRSE